MIVIEKAQVRPFQELPSVMKAVKVHVLEEEPEEAMAMLHQALMSMVDIFIEQHPKDCAEDCVAYKAAKNMKYHLDQINDETRTIIAASKANDNKGN